MKGQNPTNCFRLLPSVTSGCYFLSVHRHCPSLLRALPEWDQETAGPGKSTKKKVNLLPTWPEFETYQQGNKKYHYLIQVTSHFLPLIFLCLQLGQSLCELSFKLGKQRAIIKDFRVLKPQGDTWKHHLLFSTAWSKRAFIQGPLPTLHTLNGYSQALNICTGLIVFCVPLRPCSNQK